MKYISIYPRSRRSYNCRGCLSSDGLVFVNNMSLQKMRNGVEWTTIILFLNEDKISEQEKLLQLSC